MANEIPLALFITMNAIAIGMLVFTLINRENFIRIMTSFISMVLSYVNSMVILSGNVVSIESDGTTYIYIPIVNTTLNYFWLFLAIVSALLMILFILDEINIRLEEELSEEEAEYI